MGINSIGFELAMAVPPANMKSKGNGNDAQIRALEQKLQQLNNDKKNAQRGGNEESIKSLEKQILEVQKELQRLKSESKPQEDEEIKKQSPDEKLAKDPLLGNHVDERL